MKGIKKEIQLPNSRQLSDLRQELSQYCINGVLTRKEVSRMYSAALKGLVPCVDQIDKKEGLVSYSITSQYYYRGTKFQSINWITKTTKGVWVNEKYLLDSDIRLPVVLFNERPHTPAEHMAVLLLGDKSE